MSESIAAAFVGDGTLLIRCADAWRRAGHTICAVASGDPAILDWARAEGIPAEPCEQAPRFDGCTFDHLFSIAWLRVLPSDVLARARRSALNFHDGLLPQHAGLNAPAWALMQGAREHGVTWHEMTAQVDRGRIARQVRFAIAPGETAFSLNARCYEAGHESFVQLVDDLTCGTLQLLPQQGDGAWHARDDRPAALGVLDLSRPATELCTIARGLDFGTYANPLALPKLWAGDAEGLWIMRGAHASGVATAAAPGTILGQDGDRVRIATCDGELVVHGLRRASDLEPVGSLAPGRVLPQLPASMRAAVDERRQRIARGEVTWRRALADLHAVELPYPTLRTPLAEAPAPLRLPLRTSERGASTLAGLASWLCAIGGAGQASLLYTDRALGDLAHGLEAFVTPQVPLTLHAGADTDARQLREHAAALLARARQAGPMARDLVLRLGGTALPSLPRVALRVGGGAMRPGLRLELCAEHEGAPLELRVDAATYAPEVAHAMAAQLDAWLQAFETAGGSLRALSLLPQHEAAALAAMNETAVAVEPGDVHGTIAHWAQAHAQDEALRWHGVRLDHAQLQRRVTSLAARLQQRGVRAGDVVGVCLDRRPELLVSVLAVLHCGAAYLPLDPDYPHERLRFMVQDSRTKVVVCAQDMAHALALAEGMAVEPQDEAGPDLGSAPAVRVAGDAPAYVIYTSGSTGQPKGVVVTHANVLNFFKGMDARVPHEPGARWLAVTSLSFDISVLELLWTLSRGITVVLHAPEPGDDAPPLDFSLFYFSSDESAEAGGRADRYRLLMEGARFADQNGFAAVWTPERHFHAFGGLYPNAAIASAAVAAITQRVRIRAGSCVSPLHPVVRLAEDWSLVDNLSNGRVGVSFAAGWQPNDFVLAPHNFAQRKQVMLDQIDTVRRLWRGEPVELPGHDGKPVSVRTLPRPVQPMLPIWLTAASNPETFEEAGRKGCNLLTHLLGQTVEEVAGKIALYRKAWREAGHAGSGQVTMMLHTFVGEDEEAVRETARGPMKNYLRSSVDLIRQAAWSFPTFVQRGAAAGRTPLEVMNEQPLSAQEMDALLDHAFSRYWRTSALIGTPERCLPMLEKLREAGVDEIACLVDFGIETQTVLDHLGDLRRLMQMAQAARRAPQSAAATASVGQALAVHAITHLQCTPSMATMLVADAEGRAGLSKLDAMLVGGEALPLPLARQLRELVPGRLLNMYGPTETTVWSSVCDIDAPGEFVPLGEPIANTTLHIRNAWDQECPAFVAGELLIGGDGVTRGYHGRPELTAQKFVADPARPGARLYRTGDLVRRHPDGRLEFLGRIDHQVKIRGHRIELGEIENTLARQPGVREAVVVAQRDTAGEAFLVGYVTPADPAAPPQAEPLRAALAQALPDIMVPRLVALRASFPLTPNGKVDRKALLAPAQQASAPAAGAAGASTAGAAGPPRAAPEDPLERAIAAIWSEVLGVPEVDRESNFFDLGGHSLLVIQVQRRLKEALGQEISVTDMFRLSTVAAIADHLRGDRSREAAAVNEGLNRAQARRALRARVARAA